MKVEIDNLEERCLIILITVVCYITLYGILDFRVKMEAAWSSETLSTKLHGTRQPLRPHYELLLSTYQITYIPCYLPCEQVIFRDYVKIIVWMKIIKITRNGRFWAIWGSSASLLCTYLFKICISDVIHDTAVCNLSKRLS